MPNRLVSFREKFAKPLVAGALLSSVFGAGVASANPSGGTVQAGQVNIHNVGPSTLHIEQMTQKAIIDWQKFGIGAGETVRFLQPNQLSVILNRVVGQDPSHILGTMSANGNVFLINPNGVLFGPNSVVNVGGLVASTLNISNEDFLNGNYRFTQDQNQALASVVNQGSITITDGGYAVLMAPLVSNEGMIVANLGQVNLMSGESATLNFDGRNLINYDIGHMDSATPGTVVVDRNTVSTLLANVIQDQNLNEAGGLIENADGTVSLVGGADTVVNSGTIQANGADGQKAGKVVLDSGRLTVLGNESKIEASGKGANSDGGEIIALSHGTMAFATDALVEAKGGDVSGDGGYIDTSGYGSILLNGVADASATNGEAGTWLIDPEFLTIVSGGGGTLDGSPDTTGLGGQTDSISENYLESLTAGTNVVLHADTQVTINDLADNVLNFQDGVSVSFTTASGDILFASPDDSVRVGGDGDITFTAGRDLYLGTVRNEGTGSVNINYGRDLIDSNGAGVSNIIGDFLFFNATNGDLQFTGSNPVEVAGFTNANPLLLDFNVGNGRVVDIVSDLTTNFDISSGGVVSSGDFQTGPGTDINIVKNGDITLNGLIAEDVNIRTTGNGDIRGGGAAIDLQANSAILDSDDDVGNTGALDTVVPDLTIIADDDVNIDTSDAFQLDLSIQTNNTGGVVTIDGQTVLSNAAIDVVQFDQDTNGAANGTNLTLFANSNRDLRVGAAPTNSVVVNADTFSLRTNGDIVNPTAGGVPGTGNIIQSNDITLISNGNVGVFDDALTIGVDENAPIRVQGMGGGATAITAQVNGGTVNIEHTDGTATFTYNDPNFEFPIGTPVANVLNATDTGAQSWSNLSFVNTGAGDVVLGVLGASGAPLGDVNVTAQGNITDLNLGDDLAGAPGNVNVFANTVNLVSLTGRVGSPTDFIETDVTSVTGSGATGFYISNVGELEVFNLVVDGSSDSVIRAANGELSFLAAGNVLTTPTVVTDTNGDTDGDTYDVAIDVTLTTGDLVLSDAASSVEINGGADNGAVRLDITTQNGSIVSASGPPDPHDIVATNADITLTASQNVGDAGGDLLDIDLTLGATSTLTVDANAEIGIGDFGDAAGTISLSHNDGDVLWIDFVDGSHGITAVAGGGDLTINGDPTITTLNYTNRTGGNSLGSVTSDGTDINLSLAGDLGVVGDVDGTDDLVANGGDITVNATGSVFADATSSAGGSVELGNIGGDVTLRNNNNLDLNTAGAGTVGGNLDVDNDATMTVGTLNVGGDASFVNSSNLGSVGGGQRLTATNLNISTDATGTDTNLETDIANTVDIRDIVADGGGNALQIFVRNDGGFNTLNVCIEGTDTLDVTTDLALTEFLNINEGPVGVSTVTATNPDIGVVNIEEKTNSLEINQTTQAFFNNSTDVTIEATGAGETITSQGFGVSGGEIQTNGNLTLNANGDITVNTEVQQTLTITSQTGNITFTDTEVDGPDDLIVTTVAGQTVDGEWDAGQSTMDFIAGTDRLLITDQATANTNVTFQTDTGDILIDFADVGDCRGGDLNDLTLIATVGAILDEGDPGFTDATTVGPAVTDADLDLRGNNVTLLANGNIGTAGDPLEVDVCDTLTARSDTGGVFTSSGETVDHVIVDVNLQDYSITFDEYVTGNTVTVAYDGSATGTLSVTNLGSMQGTDLTLIERGTRDVEIGTNIDNTGGGDLGVDDEFVRIISGGGITNTSGSTITSNNGDLIANTGNMGTAANPILFTVEDICVSANGLNVDAFVENTTAVRNLYLSVNQDGTGAGDVNVIWDEGGTRGVSVTNTLLDTVSNQAGTVAGDAGSSSVVVVNGPFQLDGQFGVNPAGNTESFSRIADSLQPGSGGSITIGQYVADNSGANPFGLDPSLEVQARGANGNITQNAGGFIDLTSGGTSVGTVTLVSEEGAIGTIANPIEIISSDANPTIVNAYTGNETAVVGGTLATDEAGDININATNDVEYRQVIGGTDLSFLAPFHDNNQASFSTGGVTPPLPATPGVAPPTPPREGDVIITGDGEICATDVRGGADSDVFIESTGPGDILVGTIAANDGTVSITNANGDIDEKNNDLNGNIFAQEFVGTITGPGTIGDRALPADKLRESLDIVVLESSLNVADGDVFLRNIGSIIYNDVQVEKSANDGLVYLVSEGVTTAGNVVVGNTSGVDVAIETRNGSPLLIGNVQAIGDTVALHSSDQIRGDAQNLAGANFANQGRIQADNVLLDAVGNIGVGGGETIKLFASAAGGTVTLAADGGGGGQILIDAGSPTFATDVVIGTVTDVICNVTEVGIEDTGLICLDVIDGSLTVNEEVSARTSIELEADDDVNLNDQVRLTNTSGTRNIGIEATTGNIVDGNVTGDDVDSNGGNIALRAGGSIGEAGPDTTLEIDAGTFAADANGGGVDVVDSSGTLNIGSLNILKSGTAVNGVDATGDICLDAAGGAINVNNAISGGGDIFLAADGNITIDALISTSAAGADVVLEALGGGGSIIDSNGGTDIDAGVGGNVILNANGGVGSVAGGGSEGAIEIDALNLAARAGNGDVNVTDVDNDGDGLTINQQVYVNKQGNPITITGVRATDDICIDVQAQDLRINEAITVQAGGDDVQLEAQGDVVIGATVTAIDDMGIEAVTGDIRETGGAGTDLNTGDLMVLRAGGNIGTADFVVPALNNPLEIRAARLAAQSGGDINLVDETGSVEVTSTGVAGNPLKSGTATTGVQGVDEVCLEVTAGELTVNQAIQSTTNSVRLLSGTNTTIGATITAADDVGIEAGLGIVDNRAAAGADITAGDAIALVSVTNAGTLADAIEIDAVRFAARSTAGQVSVADQTGNLQIADFIGNAPTKNTPVLQGVSAATGVCIDVVDGAGNLIVDSTVVTTTGNLALEAGNDVVLNNQVSITNAAGATLSIEAQAGDIVAGTTPTQHAVASAGTMVLSAAGGIGVADFAVPANSRTLSIQATNLAAEAGTGDVNIQDTTGSLNIVSGLSTLKGANPVDGVTAGEDICLEVTTTGAGGGLNINANITSGATGEIELSNAGGNMVVGPGAVVTSNNRISVQSAGDLVDNNDNGGPDAIAFDTNNLGTIVIETGGDVRGDGTAGADSFHVDAGTIAADIGGNFNILEENTYTVGSGKEAKGPTIITGITVVGDICETVGGDYIVGADVTTDGSYAISAGGNIILGDNNSGNGVETVTVNGAAGTISLEAGGAIISNNGAIPAAGATVGNNASLVADSVVMTAGTGIGNDVVSGGNGNEIGISAANLAADGGTGDVNVVDLAGDLTVGTINTIKGGAPVVGVQSGDDVCIDVRAGSLRLDEAISSDGAGTAGPDTAVVAIRVNNNLDLAGQANRISAPDKISIEAVNGRIIGIDTVSNAADFTTTAANSQIVISTDGRIGNGGLNQQLQISTDQFAATVADVASGIFVEDIAGDLLVTQIALEKGGGNVTGIIAPVDVCLTVANNLVVGDDIIANTGDVIVDAGGNVTIGDGTGVDTIQANQAGDQVSILAGGEIIQGNAAGNSTVLATEVLLDSGAGVGNAQELEIEADVLAADGGTGDMNVIDRSGDLEVNSLSVTKNGTTTTVDGVEGDLDICIDVIAGSLTLTEGIGSLTNPDNVALRALDEVNLNNGSNVAVEAVDSISIESVNGGIVGLTDDGVADLRTTNAGTTDFIVISTNDAIGAAGNELEIETDNLAARTTGAGAAGVFVEDLSGNLVINAQNLAKGGGAVVGVQTAGDICIDVSDAAGGNLTVERIVSSGNETFLAASGDVNNNIDNGTNPNENITATNRVIIEAGDEITDGFNDDATTGGAISATNVILNAANGIGDEAATFDVEVVADNLSAESLTAGDVNIDELGAGATNIVEQSYTDKNGVVQTITGVQAAQDVCLDTAGALNINEDVVSGLGGAASEAAIRADGTVTIGDGAADGNQVRNATANAANRISIETTVGDIVDNNGVGTAATDANGGDVVLRAAGTIGTTDFALPGVDVAFEINANRLAANSGDDVNIIDLDTNADGLDVDTIALAKGGGNVTGVTATNDICLDVVNGNLTVNQNIQTLAGSVALRTQDTDGVGEDGDILFNGGFATSGLLGPAATVSVESASTIETTNLTPNPDIGGVNVVLSAEDGIGTNGNFLEVDTANFAAENTAANDLNVELRSFGTADVTITSLNTLKGDSPVVGVQSAEDVCIDVVTGDNLQINESVVAGTAAGGTGNVHLEVDGNVTIGNGAGTEQVRTTDLGQTVVIDAGGNITDNNDAGVAAISALGGDVILRSGGTIGDAQFNAALPATGTPVEIDADDLAANAIGDINIVDLDSNADGLDIEELTFNNKVGVPQTITGVQTGQDICIDVVNGDLDVNQVVAATAGSVALRTRDADDATDGVDDGNINLNGVDVTALGAGQTVSLESAQSIVDTVDGAGVVRATNVVMLADTGIGETGTLVETDASNLAARNTTSGDINIEDGRVSNANAGLVIVDDLFTLKGGVEIDGIDSPLDICLDVVDDLTVNADMIADRDVAIESSGNIVLGDAGAAGTLGVITAGDGLLGNNQISTVSIEAAGAVTDGNGLTNNITANATDGAGATVVGGGDLVVDAGSFGAADNTPAGAIEVNVARVAGQATNGDFSLDDLSGDLEIAEGLSTLKTPTTFSGITATADICVDAAAGNLFVNADVRATDGVAATPNNIALAANGDVNLGDTAGAQSGQVVAGNGAGVDNVGGTVSVEARTGMVQDGQQDDAGALITNIVNRGGDTVISSATGVGGEDDLLPGARPDDEIEVDTTNFAAAGGTGDVRIHDIDTDADGLISSLLTTSKDLIPVDGITAAVDICITVDNTDIVVAEDITAGGNVALRTNRSIILGDDGIGPNGPTQGIVTAGNDANRVGTISLEAVNGDVVDNNGATVNLVALGDGTTSGGNVVINAGGTIGDTNAGTVNEIETDTLNFAAAAGTGDVNVIELDTLTQDGLTIGAISTIKQGGTLITGVTAQNDVCIDVVDGDLRINEDVTGTNGFVALRTQDATPAAGSNGDIIFGNDNAAVGAAADQVTAGSIVSVEASGDAIDNNGANNAAVIANAGNGGVVFVADDVAAVNDTDGFEIQAGTVAANINVGGTGNGNVFLDDLTGDLTIGTINTLKGATVVDGITATNDICVDVLAGSLNVNENVTANNDVALRANNNIVLGDSAGLTVGTVTAGADGAGDDVISLQATTGSISDNNGGTVNLVTDADGGVVMSAATGIGDADDIETDTTNIAANGGTGDVNVIELDTTTADGLTVASVADGLKGLNLTGITAGVDVCVDVVDGDLRINEDVTATNGFVALRTQDATPAAGSNGDIIFGNDNAAVGAAADQVTAGTTVSVEASGDAIDNNGANNAAVIANAGNGNVVFVADDVAAVNDTDGFEIQAGTVAANINAGGTGNGNVFLDDLTGDLTIGTVNTIKGATVVDGITATNDICVDVLAGSLNVNENVTANNDVALRANNNIVLGESAGNTVGTVTAGADGAGDDVISVQAVNGSISDNNGLNTNLVTDADGGVVMSAATGIGDADDIETDTTNIAANGGTGDVNVVEVDVLTQDGLTVASVTDGLKGLSITGITTGTDICLDVVDGDLRINENVTATNGDIALRTQQAAGNSGNGDIRFGDNTAGGGDAAVETVTAQAADRTVSVEAAGLAIDDNGANNSAIVANGTNGMVVFNAQNVAAVNGTDGFEIDAGTLSANASNGNVFVDDQSGNLSVIQKNTLKGNTTIDGVTATGDVCIDVEAGDLDVTERVTGTNVALQASGSVTLSGADSVTATTTTSVEAGTEIIDTGAGSFVGQNVVMESGTGIGNTNAVTVNATNFAAAGGTGRVNVQDVAGGMTVVAGGLTTLKGGDPIVGVTAAQDVCIDVIGGGDLVIDEVVNAGTIAALQAEGNIASNATTSGTNKVSVSAGGNVTDGNGNGVNNFVGDEIVMSAAGDIGTEAAPIDIDSGSAVAAVSTGGSVNLNETVGNLTVGELDLEKNGGTVTSITADEDVCITVDDGTLVYTGRTIQAGDVVAIRTRDTLVTGGRLISTGANGTVSVEVTDGGIQDGNGGFDIQATNAVLRANDSIGSQVNPIDTRVDTLAVESITGDVDIYETNGLKIAANNLAKGGGLVNGGVANNDIRVEVGNGNLELETITAGNDVSLVVNNGDVLDCNGGGTNINAGGDVDIVAPHGCVGENGDTLEITAGGTVSIIEKNPDGTPNDDGISGPFVPIRIFELIPGLVLPPGVFAQDNVKLGETSFYLDELYGYLTPEELDLIIDELNAYNYMDDADFLLEKHPTDERDDNQDDEEN